MKIIPKPDEGRRAVMLLSSDKALFTSHGDLNYACGSCSKILLKNMLPDQVNDLVIRYFTCEQYNEVE